MNNKNSFATPLAVVAVLLSVIAVWIGWSNGGASISAGATANQTSTAGYYNAGTSGTGGFKVNGTAVFTITSGTTPSFSVQRGFNFGTCSAHVSATTLAASSTTQIDCQAGTGGTLSALSGITYGDKIVMSMASTTVGTGSNAGAGLIIRAVDASSTAGVISMQIYNGTGATFTWTAAASSSFRYFAWR